MTTICFFGLIILLVLAKPKCVIVEETGIETADSSS
jgi:hypothetical protein